MNYFQKYEIKKVSPQSDEYALVIYLEDHLTEFSDELGTLPSRRKDILATARQILNDRYPSVKVTVIKVILGGLVVSSLSLFSESTTASAAEPTGTKVTQTQNSMIYYQVSPGDTLWNISVKFKTSIENIKRANNLTSDILKLNQQLIIPKAFHTVATGDYLTVLAKNYGTSVEAIKEANGLTSDSTRLGQTLIIPMMHDDSSTSSTTPTQPTPTPTKATTYIVVAGDSLSVIAKRFGTTVDALHRENQLTSDVLRIGQSLLIPGNNSTNGTAAPVNSLTTYTVVAGDSLSVIAKRFGTTVDGLINANNLNTNLLKIGQSLTIPVAAVTTPVSEPNVQTQEQTAPAPSSATNTYTVVAGDNLWLLAKRFGTNINAIKTENNLISEALQIGQKLIIPTSETNTQPSISAPEVPVPVPAPTTVATTHTVIAGENLWFIANKYGTTIQALRTANNLKTDVLQIGQVITIPSANSDMIQPIPTAPEKEVEPTPTPTTEGNRTTFVYAVRSGDSLSVIANRFGVTAEALRTANHLTTDFLQIGQALTIPNGLNAPAQTGANTITYKTHTVVSGDNIWTLSVKYGIPQTELLRANNLTMNSSLSIGQKLTIPVHHIAVKGVVGEKYGEYLDWFTEAQYVFPIGANAKVTDLTTGKSFYIQRTIGANHADSETLTISDTNIAKSIWGGFSWIPRAVIVEVDGRKLAGSMTFYPHEQDYIPNNGINGHFDVYFGNSIRHKDGLPDPSHQAQVEKAAGIFIK